MSRAFHQPIQHLTFVVAGVLAAGSTAHCEPAATITFELDKPGRTSLAVFSPDGRVQHRALLLAERLDAGTHTVQWDGLDRFGKALPPARYRWRLITHDGLKATYLTAIGTNAKAGSWERWPGNHLGPTCVAVGRGGFCVGAASSEGPPSIQMFETDETITRWYLPEGGWSHLGPMAMGMNADRVVSIRQDMRVVQNDLRTGKPIGEFDALWQGDQRDESDHAHRACDLAVDGNLIIVAHYDHDAVRWYDFTGKVVREVTVPKPRSVAVGRSRELFVISDGSVVRIPARGGPATVVKASELVDPLTIAYDSTNGSLLVANGRPDCRILRFSARGTLTKSYGVRGGRKSGPYHPDHFGTVADIEVTPKGEFYVVESDSPRFADTVAGRDDLRRVFKMNANGEILHEWFGGPCFFNNSAAVPGNPRELYYNVSRSTLARFEFDPATGDHEITHLFIPPEEGWGGGLFPDARRFPHYRPIVRNGQLYLHSGGRFLVKPDLENGRLIPVAAIGFQRYPSWIKAGLVAPEPFVAAAKRQGLDPAEFETYFFAWSDTNGNGELDPDEFQFADKKKSPLDTVLDKPCYADLDENFNLYTGHMNPRYGLWNNGKYGLYQAGRDGYDERWSPKKIDRPMYVKLPNVAGKGEAPAWNLDNFEVSQATLPDDAWSLLAYTTARAIHVGRDGRVALQTRSSLLPGDKHNTNWPSVQIYNTRLVVADGNEVVQVLGKHASNGPPRDVQVGYPTHILGNVGDHLVVCDRDRFTTAWTRDGLSIGTLFDQYEAPGRDTPPNVDDWESAGSIHDLGNGEALWFTPRGYYGRTHNHVYRVTGWNDLRRLEGVIELTHEPKAAVPNGDGLHAEYFANPDLKGAPLVEQTDPRLWFSDEKMDFEQVAAWAKDGPARGIAAGKPFSVRWTGRIVAPFSERFWFRVYNARVTSHGQPQDWEEGRGFARVYLNGHLIIDKWKDSPETNEWESNPINLRAGETYDLRIEYGYPGDGKAQFSLSWCCETEEWRRVQQAYLHSDSVAGSRPVVKLHATQRSVRESERRRRAGVRFEVDKPIDRDLEIRYRLSGNAAPGVDYERPSGSVTLRAGQRSADLEITPLNDRDMEGNEQVVVHLMPSPEYLGDGSPGETSIVIEDDENVVVDDTLDVYFNFDGLSYDTDDIPNQARPPRTAEVLRYRAVLPKSVPGPTGFGEAIFFPPSKLSNNDAIGVREKIGILLDGDDPEREAVTISFWFRTNNRSGGICRVGNINFALINGRLQVKNGGQATESPRGNAADNRWHHVAYVWLGSKRQHVVCIDGQCGRANRGPVPSPSDGRIQLGRCNHVSEHFRSGALDDFRVYSRVLKPQEVQQIFKQGSSR